ncbi:hypothetical protein ACFRAM_23255 [Paenibacillus sp. NPDC056722]|uniref:hypothetical protein n=1 Tax=Paenibacillus sp. NPDC056722 TaxID=3345924 RepID=UPI003683FC1F
MLSIVPMAMIDKKSGQRKWFSPHYPDNVIIENERIIFCEGDSVFAVDINTGKDEWFFKMKHDNMNIPAVHRGK